MGSLMKACEMALLLNHTELEQLLHTENEWRNSRRWQERYAQAHTSTHTDWLDVTADLQQQLMSEALCRLLHRSPTRAEVQEGVEYLRSATRLYPDLASIPLYVKYNRVSPGEECRFQSERMNHPIPSSLVVYADDSTVPLRSMLSSTCPTVIVASSVT